MNRPKLICLKRIVIGFAASCLAVTVTVWALRTYLPQSSHYLYAGGAAFATFYCMSISIRAAIREAYHAGEIGRRLPTRRTIASKGNQSDGKPLLAPARTIFSRMTHANGSSVDETTLVSPGGRDN